MKPCPTSQKPSEDPSVDPFGVLTQGPLTRKTGPIRPRRDLPPRNPLGQGLDAGFENELKPQKSHGLGRRSSTEIASDAVCRFHEICVG